MTEILVKTDKLDVVLGAPDRNTLVLNPHVGRDIELWKQQADLNLYLDQDDFIEANDNYSEVSVEQENDFEKGSIKIKNELKKELGQPGSVKVFRKLDNVFLKSLDD